MKLPARNGSDEKGLDAYYVLKAAVDTFGQQPEKLDAEQLKKATKRGEDIRDLEDMVLNSPNAARVSVPDAEVDNAVAQIQDRYENEQEFERALMESGVRVADLRRALWRELAFDAVMNMVGDQASRVTAEEVETFYTENPDQFDRPELRTARHILITINDDYEENKQTEALRRIAPIADHLQDNPGDFADQAVQHSECPTAVEGGLLGRVPPGKLYPELDRVLFKMEVGEIAGPIESETGYHILMCEKIEPGEKVEFSAVRDKLEDFLNEQQRKAYQKGWIAKLSGRA
ncbi:nitrogen fixation protein NifM [Magnetovibrio sp. PR-2]|uniref:nitrogen fixation protein NifM n=1 Tax=Magnetovibrio sp. PR-2 TaxID=3120356 RepID=UPI002FCDEFAF